MPSIYKMDHQSEVDEVLSSLQNKLAQVAGVTVQGNRLTIRWEMNNQLVQVHTIIESVRTPSESKELIEQERRMSKLFKKYEKIAPDLREDLYEAETGENSQ